MTIRNSSDGPRQSGDEKRKTAKSARGLLRNADLLKRRNAAVPRGVASAAPIFVVKAENAEVWDAENRRYIDFAAGIAVCNTGHRHPKVVAAVEKQNACFSHTAFQVMPYETYISLAERLNEKAPIKNAKTIFITTGTEAVENAVKIARHYTKRLGVIAFTGGFYQAPQALMTALREICDAHGIVLICDEVQTGFARTGKLFATEHFDIEPDLIAVAKALAGGYPLAGVIGKAEIMDSPDPGGLGGTYGGSPIGCAAAHAVLDVIEEENLCERSSRLGARMIERLQQMKDRNDTAPIGDIRGLGAMVAFELVAERNTHKPDPEATKALTARALAHGLVLLSCGYYANTIRILAPLTIADETLDEGLDIIEKSLVEINR